MTCLLFTFMLMMFCLVPNESLSKEFSDLMSKEFEMSMMGELTILFSKFEFQNLKLQPIFKTQNVIFFM